MYHPHSHSVFLWGLAFGLAYIALFPAMKLVREACILRIVTAGEALQHALFNDRAYSYRVETKALLQIAAFDWNIALNASTWKIWRGRATQAELKQLRNLMLAIKHLPDAMKREELKPFASRMGTSMLSIVLTYVGFVAMVLAHIPFAFAHRETTKATARARAALKTLWGVRKDTRAHA
jgi:hypothetical protein